MKIISVGEVLWDVLPAAEHLGGAPFNFAYHAHLLRHQVHFVSAVGNDPRGLRALAQMEAAGLSTRLVHRTPDHATGIVTVNLDAVAGPQYKIHRPAAYDFPVLNPADINTLSDPAPDWLYFGTLQQMSPQAHERTLSLMEAAPKAKRFYDVNLRVDSYTPELIRNLANHAHVLKLNEQEMPVIQEICGISGTTLEEFCRNCARTFQLEAVCVTRSSSGCALLLNKNLVQRNSENQQLMNDHSTNQQRMNHERTNEGSQNHDWQNQDRSDQESTDHEWIEAPAFQVQVSDTIGAGDAFSAALVHGLGMNWPAAKIADFANRVGALVASRPGGTPKWTLEEAMTLKPSIR